MAVTNEQMEKIIDEHLPYEGSDAQFHLRGIMHRAKRLG
jgi:hypothetical protein